MSTIRIGNDQRELRDADRDWIVQRIIGHHRDGREVCLFVRIHEVGANLSLSTPACQVAGVGGGRAPNALEATILKLWERHGLNTSEVQPGRVISFLEQVQRLF